MLTKPVGGDIVIVCCVKKKSKKSGSVFWFTAVIFLPCILWCRATYCAISMVNKYSLTLCVFLSTASSLMSVRPQHIEPALSSQRLVEDPEGEAVPLYTPRPPSRPRTRQARSHSIGQLDFLPVPSLSSSLSHPSITSPVLPSLLSSSGSRFAGLLYRSSNCYSVEAVLSLSPMGFTAARQHRRAESSGYLTLSQQGAANCSRVTHNQHRIETKWC